MAREPLKLEVVTADRVIWEGDAVNVIARTVEGDIGILPGHSPLLAALVPSVVEIVTADGLTEVVAVEDGFLSVSQGHVWILTPAGAIASEISLDAVFKEAAPLRQLREAGDISDEQKRRLLILEAQIRVAERAKK
ncbi:MAG: ATP synthase F1 subunit epsilon [Arachnia propionica]|nr:MAG: ATP synthase F1 subunit epsilon [Arachnia propionica]